MKKCGEQADQYMVIFLKKCAKQVIICHGNCKRSCGRKICSADGFKVVTMPPAAAQMMMKAVGFLLLVHICFQFVVSLFWRHQYTTEHVVTPGDPEPGRLSVAAILPAQMIGAFKPVYL